MNLHFWLLLGTLYDMSWGFAPQNFHLAHKSCRTCCTQESKSWNFAAFLEHCVMKWQDKTALLRPFSPLVCQSANYLGSNLTGKFAESFELARLSADVASLSNARGARSAEDAQSCSFRHRCFICSRQTRASLNSSECSDASPTKRTKSMEPKLGHVLVLNLGKAEVSLENRFLFQVVMLPWSDTDINRCCLSTLFLCCIRSPDLENRPFARRCTSVSHLNDVVSSSTLFK